MKADALTWPRPRVAAGSPAAARERGESARAARVVLSESCPQAAARRCRSCGDPVGRAPGRGLRSGGGFPADRPPGPGPGRQADSARACAVLAGDLSRAHAGRRARRPRLPGCPGADVDGGPDQRALPPEPGSGRRAGWRAARDRHVRPARDAAAAWTRQLDVLYVDAAGHGTGAGRALLEAVIDPAEPAALWVADPNPRAGVSPQARLRCRRDGPVRGRGTGDPHGPRHAARRDRPLPPCVILAWRHQPGYL